ncbi:hypothetical protein GPECTOR_915g175 [Gonium pectorale]|uniref:Uncharacterized protein n=1 Tax=Gonium pectorale TaxID=33097 RepID=A0A150FVI7_GONPE|nr:hypothetical protein GPECTOR_915g175 [Gonium pectorale]|eukprot:KXZ41040.1 hypothetical protein GPECTOR_915g175 [Gonium pectorale]
MTRGRLLDRIRLALAGGLAVREALGEETNFLAADLKRATRMARKFVFYYGFSDVAGGGITTWANQPYSGDFLIGQQRARKVVSTDAMDAFADWPTQHEDFRWPYGVEWLNDAYPVPYWVRKQEEDEQEGKGVVSARGQPALAAAGGGGGGASGGQL